MFSDMIDVISHEIDTLFTIFAVFIRSAVHSVHFEINKCVTDVDIVVYEHNLTQQL